MKKLGIVFLLATASLGLQAQTKAPKTAPVKKESKACLSKGKSCCNDKALSALRRPIAKPVAVKKTK